MSEFDKLFDLVNEIFEVTRVDYGPHTIINELESWDSLKYMAFILGVEEKFDISLTGDEIAGFRTFNDVMNKIGE
jgi:acyl carrier protein